MSQCKKKIRRFIELLTGERVDQLEVAYARASSKERTKARDEFVEEKAKHRVTAAVTVLGLAAATYLLEKLLPEA